MTTGQVIAFIGFAFVTSITPGPNNTMLLASGARYGLRRTVPHMVGIVLGVAVMLVLVGIGIGQVFLAAPVLHEVLRYGGAAYLIWLAWTIATSGPVVGAEAARRPLTLWQAAGFQWVNPKAWIMVVGAIGAYVPQADAGLAVVLLAVLMAVVTLGCTVVWAGFGTGLRPFLSGGGRARAFNLAMALLLLVSLVPMLAD